MYADLAPYYHRWYHERPVLITPERAGELRRLHGVLLKCAHHFTRVWQRYLPLSEKERDILAEQARHPFRAGTWRPDYLICPDGSLRICEITSRFFAHGIFMSWFAHERSRLFMEEHPGLEWHDGFGAMMDRMLELTGGRKRIFVFKSADKTGEIRLYKRFYEAAGLPVTVLEAPEVENSADSWARPDCFLISALNQKDLLAMSDRTLTAMIEGGMCSDMRNIFLLHDKRFMELWFDDGFTSGCLDASQTAFLRAHAIPTFEASRKLADLRARPEEWILKPWRLGKSEGVRAGAFTSPGEWEALLDRPEGCVAQPFLPQKTFPCTWEGQELRDYMCGMMLCIDDDYFESGYFRCSSHPVTNVVDDRKAAALYSGAEELKQYCDLL